MMKRQPSSIRRQLAHVLAYTFALGASSLMAAGCFSADSLASGEDNRGFAPEEPPPTGTRWVGTPVDDGCGRISMVWLVADEVCAATDEADYFDAFVAPMFRDGALIGDTLYAVDGTNVWSLDASDPSTMGRQGLVAGLGQPLAAATHGGDLVLAAGREGLVVADVTDPARPARAGTLALPGPAMDVFVEGDTAWIAAGTGGVVSADLSAAPTLGLTAESPGFAAGVQRDGDYVYTAACDTFAVLSASTGALVGEVWVDDPYENGLLVAPAKDVAVAGDIVFVAAGRFGAVSIDVSIPSSPVVLGHCTQSDDLSFYASGVRIEGNTLFIGGGEWGVMTVDVSNPSLACRSNVRPRFFATPTPPADCSISTPTWVELPPPPRPAHDPLQTLVVGNTLYAFGDASRVGLRSVDVWEVSAAALGERMGRYEEPRLLTDLVAAAGKVAILGAHAGLFTVDPVDTLVAQASDLDDTVTTAAILGDGRLAWVDAAGLTIEGAGVVPAFATYAGASRLRAAGDRLAVPFAEEVILVNTTSYTAALYPLPTAAAVEPVVEVNADLEVYAASAEWDRSFRLWPAGSEPLSAHGVFVAADILNPELWQKAAPRRLLAHTGHGLLEVATLAKRAAAVLHGAAGSNGVTLPAGSYSGLAQKGDHAYLVVADRGAYTSTLITLALGPSGPNIVAQSTFRGVGVGVAVDGDILYVGDADAGIRVYDVSAATPSYTTTVAVGN